MVKKNLKLKQIHNIQTTKPKHLNKLKQKQKVLPNKITQAYPNQHYEIKTLK